jgi:hypothetical protein
MDNYDTEEARAHRRLRLVQIKPTAAPRSMSQKDFCEDYVDGQIIAAADIPSVEESDNEMFCPACQKPSRFPGMMRVNQLHVTYEKDVLGNYPLIASTKCFGCGWEELIPVVVPEVTAEEESLLKRAERIIGGQAQARQVNKAAAMGQMYGIGQQALQNYLAPSKLGGMISNAQINSMQPGGIIRVNHDEVEISYDKSVSKAWDEIDRALSRKRDAAHYAPMIDSMEADERNSALAQIAQMTQMHTYQQAAAAQMAQKIDESLMRDLMNISMPPVKPPASPPRPAMEHFKARYDRYQKP